MDRNLHPLEKSVNLPFQEEVFPSPDSVPRVHFYISCFRRGGDDFAAICGKQAGVIRSSLPLFLREGKGKKGDG